MQIIARRYDTLQVVAVLIDQGQIQSIEPAPSGRDVSRLPWIAPGFVDLQVNGYGGIDFNRRSLTVEDVAQVCLSLDQHGVTRFCPTVTTDDFQTLQSNLATIARACEENAVVAARVAGIHLEGPFISPEEGASGIHPKQHICDPSPAYFDQLRDTL